VGPRRRPWSARGRDPAEDIDLGDRLRAAGDVDGARAAFRRAADSGHPDLAPAGHWWTGTLLRETGDPVAAADAYRAAVGSGHAMWSLRAGVDLADLLVRDDPTGAALYYRAVLDSADPSDADGAGVWAHRAAVKLVVLLDGRGDAEGAEAVRLRVTGDDADRRGRFALDLADELHGRGDVPAAAAALREAVALGGSRAPRASFRLGLLLRENGDADGARAALRAAAGSGDAAVAPQAAALLRRL
jgi:hypothetical protein